MTTYLLTGNTFRHRAFLRSLGAAWIPERKAWKLTLGGNAADALLRDLWNRGVRSDALPSPRY